LYVQIRHTAAPNLLKTAMFETFFCLNRLSAIYFWSFTSHFCFFVEKMRFDRESFFRLKFSSMNFVALYHIGLILLPYFYNSFQQFFLFFPAVSFFPQKNAPPTYVQPINDELFPDPFFSFFCVYFWPSFFVLKLS